MGASQIANLGIGTSDANGHGTGTLAAGGGVLRVGTLQLGVTTGAGATAVGTLALTGTAFIAQTVVAGSGAGGTAHISLRQSPTTIIDTFTLLSGDLLLDDSLMTVGNLLTLGGDAALAIDVDGLLRGSQYGAIDAALASLAGALVVDFSDFVPVGDAVFDILRSSAADGIAGDFTSFLFTGLHAGYTAYAGIELDGVEVYRVRITQVVAVPEPMTLALVLPLLIVVLAVRRRAG
jgi:hypothetical protein